MSRTLIATELIDPLAVKLMRSLRYALPVIASVCISADFPVESAFSIQTRIGTKCFETDVSRELLRKSTSSSSTMSFDFAAAVKRVNAAIQASSFKPWIIRVNRVALQQVSSTSDHIYLVEFDANTGSEHGLLVFALTSDGTVISPNSCSTKQ